jgi:hypothetical protein
MNKQLQIVLRATVILMIPLTFLAGLYIGSKRTEERAERVLQSTSDALIYASAIYSAQHYGELLLYARQANTTASVRRLEYLADASLLTACAHKTNALSRPMPKGPWSELRADRSTFPRGRTAEDEVRIASLLDELVREQPQQGDAPNERPALPVEAR